MCLLSMNMNFFESVFELRKNEFPAESHSLTAVKDIKKTWTK